MKSTIIISLLVLVVGAYLAEEIKRLEWLIEQNNKPEVVKETE